MRVESWLLLGLMLVPPACVPDAPPEQQAAARTISQPLPHPDAAERPPARPRAGRPDAWDARDFARVDRHALGAPPTAERSLDGLAAYLARGGTAEVLRARAVFRWLTDRIAYDAEAYNSGRFRNTQRTPEAVLRARLAVCDGYAGLFEALAQRMGLAAVIVSGHAKGFAYAPGQALRGPADHAWNAVRIDGAWYLLDATWGAGTLDPATRAFRPRFEPNYFLVPPEQFIYRHLPDQPAWQLLESPLSPAAFVALPTPSPAFFRDALRLASHRAAIIEATGEVTVRIGAPAGVRLTARLLRDDAPVAGEPTLAQRAGAEVEIRVRPPRPGAYTLQVLSKAEPADTLYESALEYRLLAATGVGGGGGFPLVYRPFAEREGHLLEPLRGRLTAGASQRFRLRVPGAERMLAAWDGRIEPLQPQGDAFAGEFRVPRGPFVIYARFAGAREYAGLLRFEGG
jgi:Transglutaminase-like superfamily